MEKQQQRYGEQSACINRETKPHKSGLAVCESVCENPSKIYQNRESQKKLAKRKSNGFNNF